MCRMNLIRAICLSSLPASPGLTQASNRQTVSSATDARKGANAAYDAKD